MMAVLTGGSAAPDLETTLARLVPGEALATLRGAP